MDEHCPSSEASENTAVPREVIVVLVYYRTVTYNQNSAVLYPLTPNATVPRTKYVLRTTSILPTPGSTSAG